LKTVYQINGSPAIGSDGTVYIGSYDGKLYAFNNRPVIASVNPNSGNQGQTLSNIIITGTNFTGATAISFGAGIMVNGFTVVSDTQITASITIAAGASPGTRDVSVTTPNGTGTINNGFTVNELPVEEEEAAAGTLSNWNPDSSSSVPEQIITSPPRISVKNVNVQPQQAQADQPVIIYAAIANGGEQSGSYTAELKINGQVEEIKTGTVGSHSAVPLEFAISRSEPGTYEIDINGQQSYFTITGEQSSIDSSRMIFITGLIACVMGIVLVTVLLYRRRSI
jgi:outer membrane protein assembly factor BamB